ncbi:hypothetical protein Tsubulata_022145, partial [Turnera subulata]
EKSHLVFPRDRHDLTVTQKISLVEALTGYTVHITTLDGRNLAIPINNVIQSQRRMCRRRNANPKRPKEERKSKNQVQYQEG